MFMTRLFDPAALARRVEESDGLIVGNWLGAERPWLVLGAWGAFTLLHSRYYAKSVGQQPSRLCVADKLATAITPAWLYLPMVRATGEIAEYMAHARHRVAGNENVSDAERRRLVSGSQAAWFSGVQSYLRRWVKEHADGRPDTWTPALAKRAALNDDGVWQ